MRLLRHLLRKPEDGGDASGAEGAPPAAAPPAAPAPPAASPPAAAAPATPAPPAASPPAGTPPAASPPATDGGAGEAKPTWREDWRQVMSKGDEKVLKRLERYASPEALSEALIHAQDRISKGDLRPVLKKDATPEQIAEWRAANGIPEKPDGYDLGKAKITEEAQALLDQYLPIAHAANMTSDQVRANLGFIAAMNKAEREQQAERDVELEDAGEEALRAEWGGEYKRNITFIHNLLDGAATPEFKDKLLGGRLADGTPIGSDPAALRFLMSLALVQNPTGTLVPGFNNNPALGVEEEIGKIEKLMREDRKAYDKDEKTQSRYRELLDAREKLKARG